MLGPTKFDRFGLNNTTNSPNSPSSKGSALVSTRSTSAVVSTPSGPVSAGLKREGSENTSDSKKEGEPDPFDVHLMLTMADFQEAFKAFRPSSLRFAARVPDASWADLGGYEDVKRVLLETVEQPFKFPELYQRFGLHPCSSVLLYGPPGCGKSLLAKVIANQCQVNFLSVKGPELLASHFGESEQNIRDLFAQARANSPCVVFFDEIDALCMARGKGGSSPTGDRVPPKHRLKHSLRTCTITRITSSATQSPYLIPRC